MFRDDHAAALARESALERELSEVRGELDEERTRVASLEERLFDRAQPRVVFAEAPPSMLGAPRCGGRGQPSSSSSSRCGALDSGSTRGRDPTRRPGRSARCARIRPVP